MKCVLGIDTSNYTTSVALVDAESGEVILNLKRLLPVKEGERGIRQSDAVFHHTVALPELMEEAFTGFDGQIVAVAVSEKPAAQEGSYMPCFLAGMNAATAASAALGVPLFKTTHQLGHVLAAVYGAQTSKLLLKPFVCFHVSGGTTDALLVTSDESDEISVKRIAKSLDLKAGQAIDRIGVKLGYRFPAGKAMDELAQKSQKQFRQRGKLIGSDCSLSGLENRALKMLEDGETPEDVARFCVDYIANTLAAMSLKLRADYGDLPLLFAGGVMSNSIIKDRLTRELGAAFSLPAFAADNAAGVALYGKMKWNNLIH